MYGACIPRGSIGSTVFFGLFLALIVAAFPAIPAESTSSNGETTQHRSVVDTADYPWSAIGRVNVAVSRRGHCTGALIGERLVVTAAHCLFFRETERWVAPKYVHFLAGYQRGEARAHSRAERYVASPDFIGKKWNASTNLPNDWALIVLQKPIGRSVGYLGWRALPRNAESKALFESSYFSLAGYPRDRAHAVSLDKKCRLLDFLTVGSPDLGLPPLLGHRCGILGGDSGAPIALRKDGTLQVVAVNSAGDVGLSNGEAINTAVPLSSFVEEVTALLLETQENAPQSGAAEGAPRRPQK